MGLSAWNATLLAAAIRVSMPISASFAAVRFLQQHTRPSRPPCRATSPGPPARRRGPSRSRRRGRGRRRGTRRDLSARRRVRSPTCVSCANHASVRRARPLRLRPRACRSRACRPSFATQRSRLGLASRGHWISEHSRPHETAKKGHAHARAIVCQGWFEPKLDHLENLEYIEHTCVGVGEVGQKKICETVKGRADESTRSPSGTSGVAICQTPRRCPRATNTTATNSRRSHACAAVNGRCGLGSAARGAPTDDRQTLPNLQSRHTPSDRSLSRARARVPFLARARARRRRRRSTRA